MKINVEQQVLNIKDPLIKVMRDSISGRYSDRESLAIFVDTVNNFLTHTSSKGELEPGVYIKAQLKEGEPSTVQWQILDKDDNVLDLEEVFAEIVI